MFSTVNMKATLSKKEYAKDYEALTTTLGKLQRQLVEKNIPVFILIEGWHGAEKSLIINQFLLTLDPRGYRYACLPDIKNDPKKVPDLISFWQEAPPNGSIHILETDWYRSVYECRYGAHKNAFDLDAFYRDIKAFERQLIESGVIVLKFFFHIDQKTQKKRLLQRQKNTDICWTITEEMWHEDAAYENYYQAAQAYIENTRSPISGWHIIPATNFEFAADKTLKTIAHTLETYLANPPIVKRPITPQESDILKSSIFSDIDHSETIGKREYEEKLAALHKKLVKYGGKAISLGIPIIIVFEGVDAAGKGGAIKRITQALLPKIYNVIPVGAPVPYEKRRHFMWRFWRHFSPKGHLTLFDRSWYGRVLVERVEGLTPEEEWERAYEEINETELYLSSIGAVIVKFYIQISYQEQLARFEQRKEVPEKNWKLTDEDWRNREKWPQYEEAASEMFARTSTTFAPWHLIATDCKKLARIQVLTLLTDAIKNQLQSVKKKKQADPKTRKRPIRR